MSVRDEATPEQHSLRGGNALRAALGAAVADELGGEFGLAEASGTGLAALGLDELDIEFAGMAAGAADEADIDAAGELFGLGALGGQRVEFGGECGGVGGGGERNQFHDVGHAGFHDFLSGQGAGFFAEEMAGSGVAGGQRSEGGGFHVLLAGIAVGRFAQEEGADQGAKDEADQFAEADGVAQVSQGRAGVIEVMVALPGHVDGRDVEILEKAHGLAVILVDEGALRGELDVLGGEVAADLEYDDERQEGAADFEAGEPGGECVTGRGDEADHEGADGNDVVGVPAHRIGVGVGIEQVDHEQGDGGGGQAGDDDEQGALGAFLELGGWKGFSHVASDAQTLEGNRWRLRS